MPEHANEQPFEMILDRVGGSANTTSAFSKAARRLLDCAPVGEVRLVSPYLGHDILRPLVEGRTFRMVTDLDACCETGCEDALLHFLQENEGRIRHVAEVHAKIVLTDSGVIFGSANLTAHALRVRQEVGCLILDPVLSQPVRNWFEDLWTIGERVDQSRIEAVAERGEKLATARASVLRPNGVDGHRSEAVRRTLGWMEPPRPAAGLSDQPGGSAREDAAADTNELVSQLRALTRSRADCDRVLDFLARAVEVTGLPVEDDRLHLNFGGTAINVTINQRYIAWCGGIQDPDHFGFILDDDTTAHAAAEKLDGAWTDHFRKSGLEDAPTLHVPLSRLVDIPYAVLESWERAIRREVTRTKRDGSPYRSSFRRHKRPFLYRVLTDPRLRQEIVAQVCATRQ